MFQALTGRALCARQCLFNLRRAERARGEGTTARSAGVEPQGLSSAQREDSPGACAAQPRPACRAACRLKPGYVRPGVDSPLYLPWVAVRRGTQGGDMPSGPLLASLQALLGYRAPSAARPAQNRSGGSGESLRGEGPLSRRARAGPRPPRRAAEAGPPGPARPAREGFGNRQVPDRREQRGELGLRTQTYRAQQGEENY